MILEHNVYLIRYNYEGYGTIAEGYILAEDWEEAYRKLHEWCVARNKFREAEGSLPEWEDEFEITLIHELIPEKND